MRLDTPLLLLFPVITVMLIACGASSDAPQSTVASSTTCDAQYVPSLEAGNHIGQEVTVCGDVKDYYFHQTGPGKPTYLLFDEGVQRRGSGSGYSGVGPGDAFAVVILRKDSKNFPPNFGPFYSGKMACATGVVEKYNDKPAIIVSTQDQIKVGC